MNKQILCVVLLLATYACKQVTTEAPSAPAVRGTWKLLSGTLIENGKTTVTNYGDSTSFIKIINDTHFAFLQHSKDSTSLVTAGGGPYSLHDSTYTEHLEYCTARNWEGHDFSFTVTIHGDTLVQKGIEKVESAGINRINIEKYIRLK